MDGFGITQNQPWSPLCGRSSVAALDDTWQAKIWGPGERLSMWQEAGTWGGLEFVFVVKALVFRLFMARLNARRGHSTYIIHPLPLQ